uniref:IP03705p (inferred by orthology to a D. melanogaster protein) n=1 Tax=Strongyloides venezuelensis TaxID=75913 RepID=A0A0K0EVM9_STRVS
MEAGTGGWPGGQACLPAVQLALEDVNNDDRILKGYELKLHHYNSKCKPGLAAKQLFELLYNPPVKLILLSGCSPVTTVIAEAAPVWNLVVLSYGASSPALSNRARFPTLFRTHPSANMHNPTRIKLFDKFKWKRITILQSVEEVFTSTAKDLEEECRKKDIRVDKQSFYGDPTDAIKTLVRQDARIIVGLYYVTEARRVLCQAYKHGLYGRKYVWFLIGWYADTWYLPVRDEQLNCTAKQMEEAAQYHFTTESIMLRKDNKKAISGITGTKFLQRLKKELNTNPAETGGYPEAPLAYDAVWALALALNCTLNNIRDSTSVEVFTYNNTNVAGQIFDCVKNTQFQGVSGKVMFSEAGDRIARTQIEQMQNGKYVITGYYDITNNHLEWFNNEKWYGKGPPADSTIIKRHLLKVNIFLYAIVCLIAIVSIGLSVFLFIFNKECINRSIIIQSQPKCNDLLIFGCILCSGSLFLMGLPSGIVNVPNDLFPSLCYAKVTMLMIGFSFAYGSMFAKVWVVHRMGVNENQKIVLDDEGKSEANWPWSNIRLLITSMLHTTIRKISTHTSLMQRKQNQLNQPIPSFKFQSIVATFVCIDFVLLLIWIFIDPLQRYEQYFHLKVSEEGIREDIKYQPVLELCQSKHHEVWIALILSYKCLLLVFGLFMAYESRNLKLRYVNDSRFAGMAIYNVAILSLVTGPVVCLLIRTQPNANFAFISVTVLLCTFISLGLVFIPKIRYVCRIPSEHDEHDFLSVKGSIPEQQRFENILKENVDLKRQIHIKEDKIRECQNVLIRRRGHNLSSAGSFENISSTCFKCIDGISINKTSNESSKTISEGFFPSSSPTTFTTTALIETHNNISEDTDNSSNSCEIIL